MSDWREIVRVAIIETIKNESWVQFDNSKKKIEKEFDIMNTSRIPGYKEDARINIELVVPIQIPPNGKMGDCKKVVETVRDQFIELSGGANDGGAQIYLTNGSWVSSIDGLNEDQCLIVHTEMPAKSWHKAIPVLRDLIKDEIQGKLLQQCVFIRIGGTSHGKPINLLKGEKLAEVNSAASNFRGVDNSCYTLVLKEYSELIEKMDANMSIEGNNNVQINSKGNATSAVGSNPMAAGGNITVNQYYNNTPDFFKGISMTEPGMGDIQNVVSAIDANMIEEMNNSDFVVESGDNLLVMAKSAVDSDNYDIAIGYLRQAIRIFTKSDDKKSVLIAKNNLSTVLSTLGEIKESEQLLLECLSESENVEGGESKQTILMNIGNHYRGISEHEKAIQYYEDAQEVCGLEHDMSTYASLCVNIGGLYTGNNMFDEAKVILMEGYRLSIVLEDKRISAMSLQNLAINAGYQGHYDAQIDLNNAALVLFRDINDLFGERTTLGNLAILYAQNKNFEEAIPILKNSINIFEGTGQVHPKAHAESNLGIIYHELEEYELAETYLTKSLESFMELGDKILSVKCQIHLSEIAKEKGETEKYEKLKAKTLELCAEIGYDIELIEAEYF